MSQAQPTDDVFGDEAYEEYEEEYEEEYTGDALAEEAPVVPADPAPTVTTPSHIKSGKKPVPNVITPSKVESGLDLSRDPFLHVGIWTKEKFEEVQINFPDLTQHNETTNELTRRNRPEARYWKGAISFSAGQWKSDFIRVFNVPVPYRDTAKYGQSFIYACLPGFMSGHFATCGKSKRPTIPNDKSLLPNAHRWWKTLNNVDGKVGVIKTDPKTGKRTFVPKSLATMFSATGKGVVLNLDLEFYASANTIDSSNITPTVPCNIKVELRRAYIVGVNQDIEGPARVQNRKPKAEPAATNADVASDDVLKAMANMGI